jgi:uncharacterized protein (DUF2237 family)
MPEKQKYPGLGADEMKQNSRYFTMKYSSVHNELWGFYKDGTPNKSPEDLGFYVTVIRPLRERLCHGH